MTAEILKFKEGSVLTDHPLLCPQVLEERSIGSDRLYPKEIGERMLCPAEQGCGRERGGGMLCL